MPSASFVIEVDEALSAKDGGATALRSRQRWGDRSHRSITACPRVAPWVVTSGGEVIVPTPVLVECVTGDSARDAEVSRVLGVLGKVKGTLRAPGEATARLAGSLRFAARTDDGIDALVAAEAAAEQRPSVLLTSDAGDLGRLLVDAPQVVVRRV